jgi:hypothetical protein
VIDQNNLFPTLSGYRGAHHARSACADDGDIKLFLHRS